MARLTIPDEQTFATFTVVTSTTAFPITFSLFAKADLTVLVDDVALDQSAFTFTGTQLDGGGYDGGTVTLNTAVDDVTVRIERNVAPARTSNFAPASTTPVGSVDQALNRVTAVQQDHARRIGDLEDDVADADGAIASAVSATAGSAAAAALSASGAAVSEAAAAAALADVLAIEASGDDAAAIGARAAKAANLSDLADSQAAKANLGIFPTVAALVASTTAFAVGSVLEAGGYRYTVVSSGEHLTTAGSVKVTVQTQNGRYPAAAWGIVPGSVTIATVVAAIAVSATAGVPLFFPAGTYEFGGSNLSNGTLVPGNDIGAVNIEGVYKKTIFNALGSMHVSESVRVHNVKFTSTFIPVYTTGDIDYCDVQFCDFINCTRSIFPNDDTPGVYFKNGLVRYCRFENTAEIDNFIGCVILTKPSIIEDVTIEYNRIIDIRALNTSNNLSYAIYVGDDDVPTENNSRIRINHNTITGCGNHRTSEPASPSFGVCSLGDDCEQIGNIVQDSGWINACYMKGDGNTQADNKVRNPEWGGVTMKVSQDTSSKNNVQTGNVVTGVVDREGAFRMFGRGRSEDNIAETTATGLLHPTEGGFAFFGTPSATQGPMKIGGTFNCPRGIMFTGAGDIEIDVNLTSAAKGVELVSSGGVFGSVDVSGVINAAEDVVYVNAARRVNVHDLDCSTSWSGSTLSAFFLYTEESNRIGNVNLVVLDPLADGVALGYAASLYAKAGGTGGLTNHFSGVYGLNVVTFRNLTHATRSFADAGLAGKTRISLSDVGIDLQGKTCGSVHSLSTNALTLALDNVRVIGSPTRTVNGSGITVADLIIQNGLMNYAATDNLAGHTNATATRSRITNNKTA